MQNRTAYEFSHSLDPNPTSTTDRYQVSTKLAAAQSTQDHVVGVVSISREAGYPLTLCEASMALKQTH